MCITEYDEKETMTLFYEEGREEGREEMVFDLVNAKFLTAEIAAEQIHVSLEEFLERLDWYNRHSDNAA